MKKLQSSMVNMVVVLTVTTLLAGFLLGYVHSATAEATALAEANKRQNALEAVSGEFDNDPEAEKAEVALADGSKATVYPIRMGGEFRGAAIESGSANGFSGNITIMIGLDKDGRILGYEVTSHSETPGLGAKMTEWFKGDGSRSVIGRSPVDETLKVSKGDGGDIDAITAATITSRAFLEAVNHAGEAFTLYCKTDANS